MLSQFAMGTFNISSTYDYGTTMLRMVKAMVQTSAHDKFNKAHVMHLCYTLNYYSCI